MLTRKLSAETPELSSVAAECRRTGEPVCVTENGRPAFVMMDMASFEAREARLSAREAALAMTSSQGDSGCCSQRNAPCHGCRCCRLIRLASC